MNEHLYEFIQEETHTRGKIFKKKQISAVKQLHRWKYQFVRQNHNLIVTSNFLSFRVDARSQRCDVLTNVKHSAKKKKKKKLTATVWVTTWGYERVGRRGTETRVRIPTWRRCRIFARRGVGECAPNAFGPYCHIFHSYGCKIYICSSLRQVVSGLARRIKQILENFLQTTNLSSGTIYIYPNCLCIPNSNLYTDVFFLQLENNSSWRE